MTEAFADLRARVQRQTGAAPFAKAVILGSGLGAVAAAAEPIAEFAYGDLPGMLPSGVAGHGGRLVAANCWGERVLFFVGRNHLYEGYTAREVVAPVRAARALGCRCLLLTCAVGGIRSDLDPGTSVFVRDHLNLLGDNPLRGERANPFIDLGELYRRELYPPLAAFAADQGIPLASGVLAACLGPSYETLAEITMLERLGADVVSMSTVPEAIMGAFLGMQVAALALVTNRAAGRGAAPLSHGEVLTAGAAAQPYFQALVLAVLRLWRAPSAESPSSP